MKVTCRSNTVHLMTVTRHYRLSWEEGKEREGLGEVGKRGRRERGWVKLGRGEGERGVG